MFNDVEVKKPVSVKWKMCADTIMFSKRNGWSNRMLQFVTTKKNRHLHNDGNSTPEFWRITKEENATTPNIMLPKQSVKPIIIRIIVIMYLGKIESGPTTKQNPIQQFRRLQGERKGPTPTEI